MPAPTVIIGSNTELAALMFGLGVGGADAKRRAEQMQKRLLGIEVCLRSIPELRAHIALAVAARSVSDALLPPHAGNFTEALSAMRDALADLDKVT